MGDVSNIQALIGRGGRIEGVEDQVGTIWEGIHLVKTHLQARVYVRTTNKRRD